MLGTAVLAELATVRDLVCQGRMRSSGERSSAQPNGATSGSFNFFFHIHYQTRRILKEMKCTFPGQSDWKAFDNNIDHRAFQAACLEFGVNYNQAQLLPTSAQSRCRRTVWEMLLWNGISPMGEYKKRMTTM